MPQPKHISVLGVPSPSRLDADLKEIWAKCREKLGFVPNVFSTYSLKPQRLRHFMVMYNDIMLAPSGLSKLEREMIAVVVSSANRCYYCLVAHGAAVRKLSGDPELGEMMALNYRVAKLDRRQRAMLDFAWKLTVTPYLIDDADREALRKVKLSTEDIFDLAETVAFFNLSNRMASATDMMPNSEYHQADRTAGAAASASPQRAKAAPTRSKPGIGNFAMNLIRAGKTDTEVLSAVAGKFPGARTTPASVAYYRSHMRGRGEKIPTNRDLKAGKTEPKGRARR
jgi:uncharacterized peroxidase-related enzyme